MSEPTVEIRDSEHFDGVVSFSAHCGICDYAVFGVRHEGESVTAAVLLKDHLAQHAPGRAVDIAVDWEPSAMCSVCEDGIGDVQQEDGGLTCQDCGTTWDIDGESGERND